MPNFLYFSDKGTFYLPKGEEVWMFIVACGETARFISWVNPGAHPGLNVDLEKFIFVSRRSELTYTIYYECSSMRCVDCLNMYCCCLNKFRLSEWLQSENVDEWGWKCRWIRHQIVFIFHCFCYHKYFNVISTWHGRTVPIIPHVKEIINKSKLYIVVKIGIGCAEKRI